MQRGGAGKATALRWYPPVEFLSHPRPPIHPQLPPQLFSPCPFPTTAFGKGASDDMTAAKEVLYTQVRLIMLPGYTANCDSVTGISCL